MIRIISNKSTVKIPILSSVIKLKALKVRFTQILHCLRPEHNYWSLGQYKDTPNVDLYPFHRMPYICLMYIIFKTNFHQKKQRNIGTFVYTVTPLSGSQYH